MNTPERSIELAKQVNQVLSQYIVIHDEIFGFSVRKIIPIPGIFKSIDFAGYMASLSAMSGQLNQIDETIDSFLEREPGSSPTASFLAGLKEYSKALAQTIRLLSTVCHNLHLKSENSGDYNLAEHNSLVKEYKTSVDVYMASGGRLNTLLAGLT